MSISAAVIKRIKKPLYIINDLLRLTSKLWPDKLYLRMMFRVYMRQKLDFKYPYTFSEKLQWLKLYDRKEIYTTMVDKYAVKDYVAKLIGDEYIIPTIGVWDNPYEIDFDSLPNQFVLKCTMIAEVL